MIYLIAEIKANNGKEHDLQNQLEAMLPPTRDEDGCIQYELFEDAQSPGLFLMIERWQSNEHLELHKNSSHMKNFLNTCEEENIIDSFNPRFLSHIA